MKKLMKPAVFLMVLVQVIVAVIFAYKSTQAAWYIRYATRVYDGGGISVNALWMSFIGCICRIIRIHPLIFTNTVLPVIVIPLSYVAYYYLAKKIFTEDETSRYVFLLVLCFINIYGYQSEKLMVVTLLSGYFTGACILIHIFLPLITAKMIAISRQRSLQKSTDAKDTNSFSEDIDDDYLEEWDMKKHPIINARNLAIALGVVVVILIASVFVLNNKINTLYDATVNLQNQLNEAVNTDADN